VRIVTGLDRVDLFDVVDKEKTYKQEGVHLAFPFQVPDGVMRIDTPWAVVRPEADQIPGACKNYFTVQRWVDVSNQDFGVTWATVDAPLVEVGAIRADAVAVGWVRQLSPSATLYSYVMNNYWETNYKAGQEGPTLFRYSIQPHGRFDSAAAHRFGTEQSQPLVVVPVEANAAVRHAALRVMPAGVLVTALKPADDGPGPSGRRDWIVRLFGASGRPEKAAVTWSDSAPMTILRSSPDEERGEQLYGPVDVPAWGMVTLRLTCTQEGRPAE
jgi:alpha-mannosidase